VVLCQLARDRTDARTNSGRKEERRCERPNKGPDASAEQCASTDLAAFCTTTQDSRSLPGCPPLASDDHAVDLSQRVSGEDRNPTNRGGTMTFAVVADNIHKTYKKSDVPALDGVSISIESGKVYGLLGPNGAGKTTLIRVLATLLKPDSGTATVEGIDVVVDPIGVRARIGLGGQYAAVDEFLTGRENVVMVGRLYNLSMAEAQSRADEVLERIDLVDAADRQVQTYSGGMRRRLDLAASLVGRPEVLFLDEPTTGIDPRSRIDIWELIRELVSGGTTLLLTTQYLEEADFLADAIGVIDHGRLIAEGTSDSLKETIGGVVVRLEVRDEHCATAIAAINDLTGADPLHDEQRGLLVIPAEEGSRSLVEVVRAMDDASVPILDIELHKPTLDDVFLSLTGHAAEPESAADDMQESEVAR
jgi:ABC-2 type transport system ATP-binding protein